MVTREHLERASLRAYEGGRLRMAMRASIVIAPIAGLCLLTTDARREALCCTVALIGLAVWLRWRGRGGVQTATVGLLAGAVPLAAGVTLACAGCHPGSCAPILAVAAAICGAAIQLWAAPGGVRWFPAAVLAALAGATGCIGLGPLGIAALLGGLAIGMISVVTLRPIIRR